MNSLLANKEWRLEEVPGLLPAGWCFGKRWAVSGTGWCEDQRGHLYLYLHVLLPHTTHPTCPSQHRALPLLAGHLLRSGHLRGGAGPRGPALQGGWPDQHSLRKGVAWMWGGVVKGDIVQHEVPAACVRWRLAARGSSQHANGAFAKGVWRVWVG